MPFNPTAWAARLSRNENLRARNRFGSHGGYDPELAAQCSEESLMLLLELIAAIQAVGRGELAWAVVVEAVKLVGVS